MTKHAIFLNGPIGTGKTTLGRALASRLSGGFLEGDNFSDPNHPWYCSILRTSQSIVREGAAMLNSASVIVVAYPLNCMNWIYFRRRFAEVGATALFVTLRASYDAIVDNNRGRAFNAEEDDRIRVMIAEGYDRRPFSNLIIDTDRTDFAMTLAELEIRTRRLLAS